MKIGSITNPEILKLQAGNGLTQPGQSTGDFAQQLMDVLKEVNEAQLDSRAMAESFQANRQSVDYHDLMIALERASTAMQLTMQVRNKLLEAYQEIARMQV